MANSIDKTKRRNSIALSFDVEDWFTVRNMRQFISYDDWQQQELRVNIGMDFIMDSLAAKNIKATFFILGWIAEQCPDLIRRISEQGHEIACHSYNHTPIDLLNPSSFERDLKKAIDCIVNITGKKIKGFRAPSFSITHKTSWALPIMKSCGLEYDSSIFCTKHPDYGIADFPQQLTLVDGLVEVPLRKSRYCGLNIPVCGGGYFRMLPYWLTSAALNNDLKDHPVVMYFHPWEFDSEQPRIKLPLLKRFRHYVGINTNRSKFLNLLNDFQFTTIENLISSTQTPDSTFSYDFNRLHSDLSQHPSLTPGASL